MKMKIQPELAEHWKNMPDAEKSCFIGDGFNIIRECGEDNV
jgi:hypothetical protein